MLNGLSGLVKTIVGSFPVEDPHLKERQESWIIDLSPVHLLEPLSPLDHMGSKPIVKEEIRVCIPPPLIVGSLGIFSSFHDPITGGKGAWKPTKTS